MEKTPENGKASMRSERREIAWNLSFKKS